MDWDGEQSDKEKGISSIIINLSDTSTLVISILILVLILRGLDCRGRRLLRDRIFKDLVLTIRVTSLRLFISILIFTTKGSGCKVLFFRRLVLTSQILKSLQVLIAIQFPIINFHFLEAISRQIITKFLIRNSNLSIFNIHLPNKCILTLMLFLIPNFILTTRFALTVAVIISSHTVNYLHRIFTNHNCRVFTDLSLLLFRTFILVGIRG